jgi:hypothetical protein
MALKWDSNIAVGLMKVFCSTTFQSVCCPHCGTNLGAVKYYSAIEGNTRLVDYKDEVVKTKSY